MSPRRRQPRSRHRTRLLVLLGLGLLVFLPMVGARDVVTSHEARVVQTARQMAVSGWPWAAAPVAVPVVAVRDVNGMKAVAPVPGAGTFDVKPWLIPVLNGQVRLQKPPLPYWCAAVLFRIVGYGEGAARFPAALLGAIATLLMLDLGRRTIGRLGGWLAALVFLSSYFVFDEYRKAMADPYLAFFSLLSIWAWIAWGQMGGQRRKELDTKARRHEANAEAASGISSAPGSPSCLRAFAFQSVLPFVFYLSLALGALAKAPLNFLHVGIAIAAYHFCFRRRPPGPWWQHVLGILLLLAIGLPWPIYVLSHVQRMNQGPWLHRFELWRYESVGEFADNVEKARRWWFYIPSVFQIALPWTPVWILGVIRVARRRVGRSDRRAWFPLLWFAITLVIFSASNVKKNAYLLPMMPAMALTAAQGLAWVLAGLRRPRWRGQAESMLIALILMGAGFGFVVPVFTYKWAAPGSVVTRIPMPTVTLGIAALLGAAAAGLPAWLAWRRGGGRSWAVTQAICFAVAIALFFHFANASFDNRRSAKPICRVARSVLEKDPNATLLMSNLPEEASVYLPLGMHYDASKPRVLVIVDDRTHNARVDEAWFQARLPERHVVEVNLLAPRGPGDARWKLFDVTVDRRWLARQPSSDATSARMLYAHAAAR